MTAPVGTPPELANYLQALEDRLFAIERQGSPTLVYACTKANLPTVASNISRIVWVTDSNILVHSDGTNWISEKTGIAV